MRATLHFFKPCLAVGTLLVPEIVLRKVLYVCMYICLSFRTHVSKPST